MRLVQQIPQTVQGIQQLPHLPLVIEQPHFRLQLTGDAAHVLPAQNVAGVGTAVQISGLPPHDAADVVAHVVIAHAAGIGAALDDTRGIPGDAADIGAYRHVFPRVQLFPVDGVQIQLRIHLRGVDAAAVPALDNGAVVLPGDAPGIMLSRDGSGESAVDDLSRALVDPHKTAYAVRSPHRPVEGAAGKKAPVAAGNAAQGILPVRGIDPSLHRQIPHYAGGLYVPEQSPDIAAARDGQTGNGVALPLKGPPKGGDGGEVRAGQVDIRLQADNSPLGPAVQGAVLCQLDQVLRRADENRVPAFGGQGSRRRQGRQQHRRQKEAQAFMNLPSHGRAPPLSDKLPSPAFRRRPRKSRPGSGHPLRRKYGPEPGR